MSANSGRGKSRRPNQATEEEIKEFFEKTKDKTSPLFLVFSPLLNVKTKL